MSHKRKILTALAIGIPLCLLIVLVGWLLLRAYLRTQLRQQTPLVSIQTPHTGEEFSADDLVVVHATARERDGLDSIELWLDGRLVAIEHVPDETSSSMLILHEGLQSMTAGQHEIIVRARSAFGASGQAATWFEVLAGDGAGSESLVDAGVAPAEVEAASVGGATAPGARAPEPGSSDHMMEWLFNASTYRGLRRAGEPIFLELEIIALRTDKEYEGLHCYLGAAEVPPRWYPDADYDASTDESFIGLGDGFWDVGAALSGDRAPRFLWQSNEPIPLEITCVALTGGGTDALELGSIVTAIEPTAWDGIARRFMSTSVEGSFELDLRITPLDEAPSWHLLDLDLDMTFPTNLRMGFYTLHWDYEPDADEEPIDGFRVILNGDVLWTESPDARESYLAYEWLSPPCGMTYTFTVDAIRGDDWSLPSNPVIVEGGIEGSDECDRTLILTFDTLETYLLPDDEDHDGWVGPLSGTFYAGEQQIGFDSHCRGSGYCDYYGMGDDEVAQISGLTSHWGPGPARLVLHVPPGEDMVIGFEIRDHDAGGGSQVLCENWRLLEDRQLSAAIESGIGDYLGNCRVTFSIHPALGSVVSDPDEPYPLPQLGVTELSVNDDTGQLRVHVRNFGRATWPAQDLAIALVDRTGANHGIYVFPEPVMRPGETDILTLPELAGFEQPPLSYCVVLDPANRVPEYVDRTDVWSREPYCRALPDLTLTDVLIDEEAQRILFTLRNIGEGSLFYRQVQFVMWYHDGGTRQFDLVSFDDVSLEPWESRVLIWEGVHAEILDRTLNGSEVRVDDLNRIAESREDNNQFVLHARGRYRIRWVNTHITYIPFSDGYGRHINQDRFFAEVRAEAAGASRQLVDWEIPRGGEDCDVSYISSPDEATFCDMEPREHVFEIFGDESLVIDLRGELTVGPYETGLGFCIWDCEHSLGRGELVISPAEWSEAEHCSLGGHEDRYRMRMHPPGFVTGGWWAEFGLCRLDGE
ncbi:MAG: fibronectin type III domain-containing protein [Anaerolineales bacterium]|jgi:hypothetical protein